MQHNNQPQSWNFWSSNDVLFLKQNIIQWSEVCCLWYVQMCCWLLCNFFSHISYFTGKNWDEVEVKFKIELRLRIKGEFRFFYVISIETMQLTIILMVLQSLFAFVVHCCIISFLTHCIHRAKEKKDDATNEDATNEDEGEFWFSTLFLLIQCN